MENSNIPHKVNSNGSGGAERRVSNTARLRKSVSFSTKQLVLDVAENDTTTRVTPLRSSMRSESFPHILSTSFGELGKVYPLFDDKNSSLPRSFPRRRRKSSALEVSLQTALAKAQMESQTRDNQPIRKASEKLMVYILRAILALFNVAKTPWFRSMVAFASILCTLLSCLTFTITFSLRTSGIPFWLTITKSFYDVFFCFEFLLNAMLVPNMLGYVTSSLGIVDFLCSFVLIALSFEESIPTYIDAFIRTLRIFKLARLQIFMPTEVKKQLFNMTLTMLGIAFVFTGLIASAEELDFLTGMYFVITTITTVGYGDIHLISDVSRVLTVVIILLTWILVPMQTQRLVAIIGTKSAHARRRFHIAPNTKHVLVCGNINNSVGEFCKEFFHPDHSSHSTGKFSVQVVILSQGAPTSEVRLLLSDNRFMYGLTYLDGNVMDPKDLSRAAAEEASAVFILSDKHCRDAARQDYTTIMTGLSIMKYINAEKRCYSGGTSLVLELLDPKHRKVFQSVAKVVVPKSAKKKTDYIPKRRKSFASLPRPSFTRRQSIDNSKHHDHMFHCDSDYDSDDSGISYVSVDDSSNHIKNMEETVVNKLSEEDVETATLTTWRNCKFVCVNQLKMHLLALTCLSPGISTFIGNLVHSLDSQETPAREWKVEYNTGTEFEIYTETPSPEFCGVPFIVAANIVHEVTGMLMFALEICDRKLEKPQILLNPGTMRIPDGKACQVRVFLIAQDKESAHIVAMGNDPVAHASGSRLFKKGPKNNAQPRVAPEPGASYKVTDDPSTSTMKRTQTQATMQYQMILAKLKAAQAEVSKASNRATMADPTMQPKSDNFETKPLHRHHSVKTIHVTAKENNDSGKKRMAKRTSRKLQVGFGGGLDTSHDRVGDGDGVPGTQQSWLNTATKGSTEELNAGGAASTNTESTQLNNNHSNTDNDEEAEVNPNGQFGMHDTTTLQQDTNENESQTESGSVNSRSTKYHNRHIESLRKRYNVLPSPKPLMDALVHEGLAIEFPDVRQHILVCGSVANKIDFVLPLRSKSLSFTVPLVFLYPSLPTEEEWEIVSHFPEMYVVVGSANDNKYLQCAGIKYASRAIVFAAPKVGDTSDNVVDAETIFTYRTITTENSRIPVVCEIMKHDNIGLLENHSKTKLHKTDFQLWNVYAAGQVYTSSVMDSLVAQSFFNHDMLKIVEMLLIGYTKDISARGYLMKQYGVFKTCRLLDVPVPSSFHSKSYGSLFSHLVSKGALPLALRRGVLNKIRMGPIGNKTPYVYTNPTPSTLVYECDSVFVLANDDMFNVTPFGQDSNAAQTASSAISRMGLLRAQSVMFKGILSAVDKTKDAKKKTERKESTLNIVTKLSSNGGQIADKNSYLTGYSSPKNRAIRNRQSLLRQTSTTSMNSIRTQASLRSLRETVSKTSRRVSATMVSLNAVVHNLEAAVENDSTYETDTDSENSQDSDALDSMYESEDSQV